MSEAGAHARLSRSSTHERLISLHAAHLLLRSVPHLSGTVIYYKIVEESPSSPNTYCTDAILTKPLPLCTLAPDVTVETSVNINSSHTVLGQKGCSVSHFLIRNIFFMYYNSSLTTDQHVRDGSARPPVLGQGKGAAAYFYYRSFLSRYLGNVIAKQVLRRWDVLLKDVWWQMAWWCVSFFWEWNLQKSNQTASVIALFRLCARQLF